MSEKEKEAESEEEEEAEEKEKIDKLKTLAKQSFRYGGREEDEIYVAMWGDAPISEYLTDDFEEKLISILKEEDEEE